jgi:hypothetical protein
MRRRLLTAVGALALALAVPGTALAHHGHGRHHHHHQAKARHGKFRFRHIGATGAGASGPTGPTGPSGPAAPENAGTVTSYSTTTNLLELKLNDESVVKGKVSDKTRIACVKATPEGEPDEQGPGDDKGEGDDQSHGDMSQGGWGDQKDNGDDNDDGDVGTTEPPCDASALVPGAVVRAAELRIGPGGTEFETIVLVR